MIVDCPLIDNPYYSYEIDLDEDAYTLTFRWNDRTESFMFSIENADDNLIVGNVKLVPAYPLLRQYALEVPVGDFVLVPYEQASLFSPIPDPRNVHKTHFLIYDTEL